MIRFLLPAAVLALAGCVPAAPPEAAPPPASGKCQSETAQRFVGKKATPDRVAAIKAISGASVVRVIRPGEMITMDYRADRVDIRTGPDRRITQVSCG